LYRLDDREQASFHGSYPLITLLALTSNQVKWKRCHGH